MSRLASIRLTSTDSESTSLSGYQNSGTSQDYVDSDVIMSPLSPKSPKSPKSPFTPKTPLSPLSPRSPRGSRPCSPSPIASPVRGGNLAYLASRRSSRDSEAGDVAPLKCARYKQRRRSNFLELPMPDHFRPRVCSLPEKPYNPRDSEELYRLRSFSITSKGVINRGDSIISKRSRSNTSVCSTASRPSIPSVSEPSIQTSSEESYATPSSRPSSRSGRSGERSPFEGSCCGSYVSSESELEVAKYRNKELQEVDSQKDRNESNTQDLKTSRQIDNTAFQVVLLGESGVGKSSLVTQFMTSEYINTYDASLDEEFGEKSVSVLLDGEESEVIFIDHPAQEMSVENCLSTYDPHACVVVYSITDKNSFKKAEDTLNYLWREKYTKEKAVIVVGNKVDLARSRLVTIDEGKSLACCHDSKFIETSSGIQHNVDELLVGIVKQVRLRIAAYRRNVKKMSASRTSLSLHSAKELLSKMCLLDSKSKSCENLHVL